MVVFYTTDRDGNEVILSRGRDRSGSLECKRCGMKYKATSKDQEYCGPCINRWVSDKNKETVEIEKGRSRNFSDELGT